MVAQIYPALMVLIGVTITAAAGMLNEARKARIERSKVGGTIRVTEAQTLWDAAEQLRHEMRDQLDACKRDMAQLRQEIADSQAKATAAATEWRARIATMEAELDRMAAKLRTEGNGGPRP